LQCQTTATRTATSTTLLPCLWAVALKLNECQVSALFYLCRKVKEGYEKEERKSNRHQRHILHPHDNNNHKQQQQQPQQQRQSQTRKQQKTVKTTSSLSSSFTSSSASSSLSSSSSSSSCCHPRLWLLISVGGTAIKRHAHVARPCTAKVQRVY